MERSQVLELLHDHMAELTGMGVQSLALFGSVARDEATPTSDVDLLIEFSVPVGLFEYFTVRERLEEIGSAGGSGDSGRIEAAYTGASS